jgi:NADH dehydrogenase FAD-containing subunit
MKKIVILGAGIGGARSANLLSHRLDLKEWAVTVVDRAAAC